MERGYAVALYGLQASFQLPVQSYIGYTLFKNGYPMAYGGSWILGRDARFGLNLFEWFRGGESAFVFVQLLRVYKQRYGLERIEIDAYQFGKDNPDGIKSGAYWFYYRFGFRSIDTQLQALAEKEYRRIVNDKNYRSSEKTLRALAESNIALALSEFTPVDWNYALSVTAYIKHTFQGNRARAIQECRSKLLVFLSAKQDDFYADTLDEWSLLVEVFGWRKPKHRERLGAILRYKVSNPEQYNQQLFQLF